MVTVPVPLTPDADGDVDGWYADDNSTTDLWSRLNDRDDGTYVTSDTLLEPGEFVVLHFGDDTRFDDLWHRMKSTAPVRPGQLATATAQAEIMDKGRVYRMARSDVSFCGPARATLFSGNSAPNHHVFTTQTAEYYRTLRRGDYQTHLWSGGPDRCLGPFEHDPAYRLGQYLLDADPDDPIGLKLQNGQRVSTADLLGHPIGLTAHTVGTNTPRKGYNSTLGIFDGTGTTDGSPVQVRDTTDDIQGYAGGINNFLGRDTILDCNIWVGKVHNGSGQIWNTGPFDVAGDLTDQHIPSGISHACIVTDDLQDHLRFKTVEYSGSLTANPGFGDGAVGEVCWYNGLFEIASITYVSGTVTCTLTNEPGYIRDGVFIAWHLEVGDEIAVRRVGALGTDDNSFNGSAIIVTAVDVGGNPKVFQYAAADPSVSSGTLPGGTDPQAHIVPHKMVSTQVMRLRVSEFLADANVDRFTRGLLFWGSRMPHGATGGTSPDYNTAANGPWSRTTHYTANDIDVDPRYRNPRKIADADEGLCVDVADAYYWEGVPGGISPAVGDGSQVSSLLTSAARKTWASRGGMLASQDDALAEFHAELLGLRGITAADERAWTDVWIGDNGWQQCEDFDGVETQTCSPIGGKTYNREGSLRLQYAVRRPGWAPEVNLTRQALVADVLATLADWFATDANLLASHHLHDTRDGISLERDDNNRAILGWGLYKNSAQTKNGQSIHRSDLIALLRLQATPSTYEVNDMTPDPGSVIGASADWGTIDIVGDLDPDAVTELHDQLDVLQFAGWDAVAETNSCHDAVIGSF